MAQTGLANNAWGVNGMLNGLRNTGYSITSLHVKLHVGHPGSLGTSNPAAGSTTQPTLTLAAASSGAVTMTGTAPSWTNSGVLETLTHISVWDSTDTAGHFIWSAPVGTPKTWSAAGETVTLAACGLQLAPLATD